MEQGKARRAKAPKIAKTAWETEQAQGGPAKGPEPEDDKMTKGHHVASGPGPSKRKARAKAGQAEGPQQRKTRVTTQRSQTTHVPPQPSGEMKKEAEKWQPTRQAKGVE